MRDETVLAAVQNYGHGRRLEFAPADIKNTYAVVLAAVQNDGLALKFASENMQRNEAVVLAAVQNHAGVLQLVTDEFKNNEAIVSAAVRKDGSTLQWASDDLKKQRRVVQAAAANFPPALRFAHASLKQDRICLAAAGLKVALQNTPVRPEKGIYSVKFGFGDNAQIFSTIVALQLQQDPFLQQFEIWNPNLLSKGTCDPCFTNKMHPCRGEVNGPAMCGKFWWLPCLSAIPTYGCFKGLTLQTCSTLNPTHRSCWRYSFCNRLKACRDSNGFMIQVCELGTGAGGMWSFTEPFILGAGQEIETEMANRTGVKVFRIIEGRPEIVANYKWVTSQQALTLDDVHRIGLEVQKWYAEGCDDMRTIDILTDCCSVIDTHCAPFQ